MSVSILMKILQRGLLALLVMPLLAHAVELDRVVAVVNDEVITSSELATQMDQIHRQLASRGTPAPAESQLRQQVLDHMVMEKLQLQFAKAHGIKVENDVLDRALERIAEQNKLTMAELPKAVAQEGLTWDQFKDNIHKQIILARVREREVDSRITVSEGEVDALLASGALNTEGREYLVSHILLRAPEGATPEQLNELQLRAQEIMQQIHKGEDFSKLVATYSSAPDAMQGGSLGWRPVNRLPAIFAQAISGMRKGDVSGILRSSVGFHIFRLDDVRDASVKKVEVVQTHARHILIRKTDAGMDEEHARRRLQGLLDRLHNGADFAELARTNSSDITAAKGGDLGWLSPGETVPEFERAMDALKPGEVSGIVESPYGWHIIQVLGRRKVDVTADQHKMEARRALQQRKSEAAYEDWLQQLRDSAWVEIKPE